MANRLLYLVLLTLFSQIVLAQNNWLDSMNVVLENHAEGDREKVDLLNSLAFGYWRVDPAKTEAYARRALTLAKSLGYEKGMGLAWYRLSISYWIRGEHDKSLNACLESMKIHERQNDQASLGSGYTMMGLIHDDLGDHDKAIFYHRKSMAIDSTNGNSHGFAKSLNNIGAIYYEEEAYEQALNYFQRALAIRSDIGERYGIGESLNNLGFVYRKLGQLDKALSHSLRSLEIREEVNDTNGMINCLENIGDVYTARKAYFQAEIQYRKALDMAIRMGVKKWQMHLYGKLVDLEKQRGNFQQALEYHQKRDIVKDSLFDASQSEKIAALQTRYETEKKEQEIASLQKDNEIKSLWQNLLLFGLAITLLAAFMIYRFYRFRNQKNKQLLETQQAQTVQLQEVDRMKSRFFANISHEFRTPLTLILGPVDSMLAEAPDERFSDKLKMMERNAKWLLKLINQLLDLSKVGAGKLELRASHRNIIPFLKGLVMSFQSFAEQKEIELSFVADKDEVLLFYEQEKVEQVITNLLSNAFKFTHAGGRIGVACRCIETDDEIIETQGICDLKSGRPLLPALEISVFDTGKGISAEQLPYIFDRFYQADYSDTREFEGTGIGLSLAKELVDLHRGSITVESKPEKGTTFRVLLPMGKDHLQESEIVMIRAGKPDEERPDADVVIPVAPGEMLSLEEDGPLVLVVDDNADLQTFIQDTLQSEYRTVSAMNGEEGLEKAIELTPDLIVSDVMMPKMNGIELCQRLKNDERTSHIPVILLTAKKSAEDKFLGLESEADDYLVKPFNTRELQIRMKNLIAIRKKLREQFTESILLTPKEVSVDSVEKVFLTKLTAVLEGNIEEESFGIERFSREMNLSRSQLHRKLVSLTGLTPSQFVRRFRLQRANELLRQNAGTISEIAYSVGFSSPSYFSKCFIDEYGHPPSELKEQSAPDRNSNA